MKLLCIFQSGCSGYFRVSEVMNPAPPDIAVSMMSNSKDLTHGQRVALAVLGKRGAGQGLAVPVTGAGGIARTIGGSLGQRTVNAGGSAIAGKALDFVSIAGEETASELFSSIVRLKVPDELNLGYFSPAANLPLKPMVGKDTLLVHEQFTAGQEQRLSSWGLRGIQSPARRLDEYPQPEFDSKQ